MKIPDVRPVDSDRFYNCVEISSGTIYRERVEEQRQLIQVFICQEILERSE